jgi:hypothetical protein
VSDLVPLEWKQDFAEAFMPELVKRIDAGENDDTLVPWIDERLKSYGADGRLLVRRAVAAYCREAEPTRAVADRLGPLFSCET